MTIKKVEKKVSKNVSKADMKQTPLIVDISDESDEESEVSAETEDEYSEHDDESEEGDNETVNDSINVVEEKADVKKDAKDSKERLKKLSFDEIYSEIDEFHKRDAILDLETVERKKIQAISDKEKNSNKKAVNKLFSLFPKARDDAVNKARKEKKKRTNTSNSGILKEAPIPPLLTEFLGISSDTLMMRPKVFSLLNNKFKELNLKQGQVTVLDKVNAEYFGFEEGHVIEFKAAQKFVANIYDMEKAKLLAKATEVIL
jgi:hypothetical protein